MDEQVWQHQRNEYYCQFEERTVKVQRVTVVEFGMYNRSGDGVGCLKVKVDDDGEIAYFTVRWKTRASFVYRTKNVDNNDKDSKNRKQSH